MSSHEHTVQYHYSLNNRLPWPKAAKRKWTELLRTNPFYQQQKNTFSLRQATLHFQTHVHALFWS